MTNATYGEAGLSYAAINWTYDGSELNTGATSPVDISYVTCTYKPSNAFTVTYKQLAVPLRYAASIAIVPSAKTQAIARTVTHTPSVSKGAAYAPSIQKVGSP